MFVGCSSETIVPPEGSFTLDIGAAISDSTLTVTGSTNLPDNTTVKVSAQRAFLNPNSAEDNPRASSAGITRVPVEDGAFEATIVLDESSLAVGTDIPEHKIAVVSDVLTVCAVIETGFDLSGEPRQPDPDVRAAVGDHGEALKDSPHAKIFGEATDSPSTWLEVSTEEFAPPPIRDISEAQGSTPNVRTIDGFCGA